jgi:hypothetical protein
MPPGFNAEILVLGPPDGFDNREPFEDNRGLRAGIGGRTQDPEDVNKIAASIRDHLFKSVDVPSRGGRAMVEQIAKHMAERVVKHDDHGDTPDYMKDAVEQLQAELAAGTDDDDDG